MPAKEHLHIAHGDPDIAYHVEWGFRKEALLWLENYPIGVNLHPIGTELHQWLLRKGQFSVFAEEHKSQPNSFTNPYTYHASVLAAILASTIKTSHEFSTDVSPLNDMEADIERIRIYNEQILYTARFCEAAIKQLLYCTQIGKKYYTPASLGTLLSTECHGCKNSGSKDQKDTKFLYWAH